MLPGRFDHNVDGKGRPAIPARFRNAFANGAILTRGLDRCIAVYPIDAWNAYASLINAFPITDPASRQFRRRAFAEASAVRLDAQGRILVPATLRSYAQIDRESVVIGVCDFVELWGPSRWEAIQASLDESTDMTAALHNDNP